MNFGIEIIVISTIFIGLLWLIMHYMTKWKTASTITNDDEHVLEELYHLAKRLDSRMDTVERLVASENPEYQPARQMSARQADRHNLDDHKLRELDRLLGDKKGSQ